MGNDRGWVLRGLPVRNQILTPACEKLRNRRLSSQNRRKSRALWAVERFLYRFFKKGPVGRSPKADGIVLFSNEPLLTQARQRGVSTKARSMSDIMAEKRAKGQSPYVGYRD